MPFVRPSFLRAFPVVGAAVALLAVAGCAQQLSVENADVPAWQATALPSASGTVADGAGKFLNAQPVDRTAAVPAGSYTVTFVCEGGGKAFLAVSSGSRQLLDLGAACYGTRESARLVVAESGPLEFSASSVDVPLVFAYQVLPAT